MSKYNEKVAVRNMQKYLRQLSYTDPDIPYLPIDGIFSSATSDALVSFQRKYGLPATGVADRESWDMLYESYLDSVRRFTPPKGFSPFPRVPENYSLSVGDIGFAVSAVQFLLNEVSVIQDDLDALAITGIYNIDTARAVSMFQASSGIRATGEVDKNTWDRLIDTYENYSKDYVQ